MLENNIQLLNTNFVKNKQKHLMFLEMHKITGAEPISADNSFKNW